MQKQENINVDLNIHNFSRKTLALHCLFCAVDCKMHQKPHICTRCVHPYQVVMISLEKFMRCEETK